MKKHSLFYTLMIMAITACGQNAPPTDDHTQTAEHAFPNPSQEAFDLLYNSGESADTANLWIESQCPQDITAPDIALFTKRIMTHFAPRIACGGGHAGTGEYGPYGTVTLSFKNALMRIDTDEIGGILQTVDIAPEAGLDRAWFETHRADFANGYGQHMDWESDDDPNPLIETYWAPEVANVQVRLTLRADGSLAQIRFSDPN